MSKKSIAIHNHFHLEVFDKNDNLKQSADAYNMVLDNFYNTLFQSGNNNNTSTDFYAWNRVAIGIGSGTLSSSRTSLFNKLADSKTEFVSRTLDIPLSTATYKARFDASQTIVGEISEVGFQHNAVGTGYTGSTVYLSSHALLTDSEGLPITVTKTDTDVLIITATVNIVVNLNPSYWKPIGDPLNDNFLRILTPPVPDTKEVIFYPSLTLYSRMDRSKYTGSSISVTRHGRDSFSLPIGISSMVISNVDKPNKTWTTSTSTRTAVTSSNYGFANYAFYEMPYSAYAELPNPNIFPPYRLGRMEIPGADGVKTDFDCPIPTFIPDTEEIRIDGNVKTRNVDYTVDPNGNSIRHPSVSPSNTKATIISATTNSNSLATYEDANLLGYISNYVPDPSIYNCTLTAASPLWFIFENPVTCNGLSLNRLRSTSTSAVTLTNLRLQALDLVEPAYVNPWDKVLYHARSRMAVPFYIMYAKDDGNPYYIHFFSTISSGGALETTSRTMRVRDDFTSDYRECSVYTGNSYSDYYIRVEPGRKFLQTNSSVLHQYIIDNGGKWETPVDTSTVNFTTPQDVVTFPTPLAVTNSSFYEPAGGLIKFTPTTARFWRFIVSALNGTPNYLRADNCHFGWFGDGIKFTTAPPAGSIISISAEVDRPWKDENYVIDTTMGTLKY